MLCYALNCFRQYRYCSSKTNKQHVIIIIITIIIIVETSSFLLYQIRSIVQSFPPYLYMMS